MSRSGAFSGRFFIPIGIGLAASVIAAAIIGESILPLALLGFTTLSAAVFFLLDV